MLKNFVKAVLGGLAISIGGTIYLIVDNHIVGAFLFSLGLFTIYSFNLNLYTGKVCYIPNKKPSFLIDVGVVFLGNAVGTVCTGYLLRQTKMIRINDYALHMAEQKVNDTILSTFIMAAFCGLLMCIAVIGFTTIKDSIGKHFALVVPIMVFILAGFEHSIADLFYFSFANVWSFDAFIKIIIIALGNMVGGMILPIALKYTDDIKLGLE